MSKELEAIRKISEQVEGFNKTLGDKVDKSAMDGLKSDIEELKSGLSTWNGEKVTEKMEAINAAITKFGEQVGEVQSEMAALKDAGTNKTKKGQFMTTEEVKKFIADTFVDGEKTSKSSAIKIPNAPIFKTAENFGYPQFFEGAEGTDSTAFTGRFIDPTLYQRKRKKNLILDHFRIESITVPKLLYLEKEEIGSGGESDTDPGGADWIVSGGQKPQRSFRVKTGEVEAKKVAIFGTIEDKLLRDVASLENWLREDFMDEMREKYNDGLLNNDPDVDADAPLGLKTNAIQYAATDAFSTAIGDPNELDAIIAVAAYLSTLKEQAGKVFISWDMWFKLHILKDSQDRYHNSDLVYVNAMGQMFIGGVEVVPADEEDVPSTHLLMLAIDPGFRIKNYGPMVFERGLNGEDFRYDRTSYRGYQEVLSYIPEHRYNSVLYDTFANVIAAITAA